MNDTKRIAEALLEYNEFLIKYHFKPSDFSADLDEDVQSMKTKTLQKIINNFESFETIYENMKDLKSNDYIKNFVELMQNSKRDTIDMIEIPILILNQKSNYLKGKLAFYCDEYPKALDYLYKSREIDLISDATILKKSIKLIKRIMNIVKGNLEKEISVQEMKISQIEANKTVNIKNHILKLKENKQKFEEYIETLDKEIEKYTYYHRDILILVDISKSMMNDDKKVEKATKNTMNIFENYITSDDRFGVFFYGNSVNSVINLSYKNINSYSYIKELLENMKKLMEENRDNDNSNVIKSIMKMYEYMKKKSK